MNLRKRLEERNKPLKRIRTLIVIMFFILGLNIIYYVVFQSDNLVVNDYNPRLKAIESSVIRGDIVDRNGHILATSKIQDHQQMRMYPYESLFSHVIGYMGYGKTGIEAYSYLDLIRTKENLWDKFMKGFTNDLPIGHTVVTTLDLELQQLGRTLLGNNKGAIVAIEPNTGRILAMISTPDFDPNMISNNYSTYLKDEASATLLNRGTQGLYPPGSTFKILTALAYLQNREADNFIYECLGKDTFGGKTIHCYNSAVHGEVTLEEAFSLSCNTSFAHIGEQLDIDQLHRLVEMFGYNQKIELELETSNSRYGIKDHMSASERAETVIGQGKTLVTPLSNAIMVSILANDGHLIRPYLVSQVVATDESIVREHKSVDAGRVISKEHVDLIESFMKKTSEEGTAKQLNNSQYTVASKTGSAENATGVAHAWYVGYAPIEEPKIALAIVIENVGTGSTHAVPIAKALLEAYLIEK
ncbi:peptidoglycan D,D-transpeptidase FtsI family protein [Petrocella sp. FN5]|uniref:peptidoglycan D,D-transpeptidase FtsI family protein n=1 Tax=Petrocella sp. FN5 TaxID=3032002 RepID=UPI0023D98A77|nr:penicillin-binding transpeptidase domain-containing protein [Petrocella sp. FN5]MDF1618459.1 penicillin-binding transpeptidase domain-containing protein [Petrocella sp. FN5]